MVLRRFSLLLLLLISFLGTNAQHPQPLAAQACTNAAELDSQSTAPTSGVLTLDRDFQVTWRLRNTGTCTWNRDYRMIFVRGDRMGSPRSIRLDADVKPGEILWFPLDLTAAAEAAIYQGIWQLRAADGTRFGPELEAAIEVVTEEIDEVILPEVLVFPGGGGGGGDSGLLSICAADGNALDMPHLYVEINPFYGRTANIWVCGLEEGTEVDALVTSPTGASFRRSYVVGAPVTDTDEEGNEVTGSYFPIDLSFPPPVPAGTWLFSLTSTDYREETPLEIVEYTPEAWERNNFQFTNWPAGDIDPFDAATGCHYTYTPRETIVVTGRNLLPSITLQLGLYQERVFTNYLISQVSVRSDEKGEFTYTFPAPEVGSYSLLLVKRVDPSDPDDSPYDLPFGDDEYGNNCFSVTPRRTPSEPLRLIVGRGQIGQAGMIVMDLLPTTPSPRFGATNYYDISTGYGACDNSEAAWWPGADWLLYQSNCVETPSEQGPVWSVGNYDLYAHQLSFSPTSVVYEPVQLTATEEWDETEPNANLDGLIVYRRSPAGTPLNESGDLRLLNLDDASDNSLGLVGRAPAWSPDGTQIAFMSDVEGSWQVYLYDLESETLTLISQACPGACGDPAWSPDGTQIIYDATASPTDFTPAALWIASLEEESMPRLWVSGPYSRPSWSETGWISFSAPDGIYRAQEGESPTIELYLYNAPNWPFLELIWSR